MEHKNLRVSMSRDEINKFYQAVMNYGKEKGELILKKADEIWSEIGDKAVSICEKEGFFPMYHFVQTRSEPFKSVKVDALPLTGEALVLREEIARDVTLRLKEGRPSVFNPSSSIEDQVKTEWNKNPNLRQEFFGNFDAYKAYLKAEAEGRVRIVSGRIMRRDADERQPFNNS